MKNDKQTGQKDLKPQRPGNPIQTGQQHNPSRLDPQKQQNQRHRDKMSGQKKQK